MLRIKLFLIYDSLGVRFSLTLPYAFQGDVIEGPLVSSFGCIKLSQASNLTKYFGWQHKKGKNSY